MNILLVLIPVTLLVLLIAGALFFWAVNHQQFDDLDTPAMLPLLEDEPLPAPPEDGVDAGPPADNESADASPDTSTLTPVRHSPSA